MFLAVCLLVIAGLSVIGSLVIIANRKLDPATPVFIVVLNAFAIVIEVLAALALMGN